MEPKYVYVVQIGYDHDRTDAIGVFTDLKDAKKVGDIRCHNCDYVEIIRLILNQKLGDQNCICWTRTNDTDWTKEII